MVMRKFSGNYTQVVDALGFPNYAEAQAQTAYREQVEKDLHRTPYVSYSHNVAQIKDILRKEDRFTEETRSFTQGDFDGGSLALTCTKMGYKFLHGIGRAGAEGSETSFIDDIRIAYLDDNGVPCALAISYLRDDPSPETEISPNDPPVAQRKRNFVVGIIRGTNYAPNDRQVTVIAHPTLLPYQVKSLGSSINEAAVPGEINEQINSKKLSQLLTGLFQGDSLNMERFEELHRRIKPNLNIDNRDVKTVQLQHFIDFAREEALRSDSALQGYIDRIEKASRDQVDFFKTGNFETTLTQIQARINTFIELQQDESIKTSLRRGMHLTCLATELVREAGNNSGYIRAQYSLTSSKLRDLVKNPSSTEAVSYDGMTIERLIEREQEDAKKIDALWKLADSYKQKLTHDPEFTVLLKEQKNLYKTSPDFYHNTEEQLKQVEGKIKTFIEERKSQLPSFSKELKEHLSKLNYILESTKSTLPKHIHEELAREYQKLQAIQNNPTTKDMQKYRGKEFKKFVKTLLDEVENIKSEPLKKALEKAQKTPQPTPPETSGFFSRNRNMIILISFALLTIISIVLIATGVLAPFGIVMGISVAVASASAVATVGAIAGAEIGYTESQYHKEYQRKIDERSALIGDATKAIEQHSTDFSSAKKTVDDLIDVSKEDLESLVSISLGTPIVSTGETSENDSQDDEKPHSTTVLLDVGSSDEEETASFDKLDGNLNGGDSQAQKGLSIQPVQPSKSSNNEPAISKQDNQSHKAQDEVNPQENEQEQTRNQMQ